jgi:hypothetical protein
MKKLFHYSNENISAGKLSIDFFGKNYFTTNDIKQSPIKRIFFYTRPVPEYLLKNCRYCYIAEISDFRVYDISKDRRGYLNNCDIHTALLKIKQKHNGIKYIIGDNEIVNLFYDVKIKEKIIC